jgi:iron complex outermembrane receptor protein
MPNSERRTRYGGSLLVLILLATAGPALAGEEAVEMPRFLDEIVVTGRMGACQGDLVPCEAMESGRYTNIGEAIADMPGIGAVRRGASAVEPVIRGLGWERVATQVGHLPLYGACPARMDPPVTYIRSHATDKVVVVRGLPSVVLGPAGTGGRIVVKPDYERAPGSPPGLEGWFRAGGDSARDGYLGEIGLRGGNEKLDHSTSFEYLNYGGYASAEGTEVPADQRGWSAAHSMGYRVSPSGRWWHALNYSKDDEVDYPALPMDSKNTDLWIYNTGYRHRFEGGTLDRFEMSAGWSNVDHTMNNEDKPNRGMLHAEADTLTEVLAGRLQWDWGFAGGRHLTAGADWSRLTRDGLRERNMVMMGKTFYDRIWPDACQSDVGGFAELTLPLWTDWTLRGGVRLDHVSSDADAVDAPSLQGRTVRESFVHFYGPEAADVKRSETLGTANLVFNWEPGDGWDVYFGGGISSRAAGVTERYFAFAPAPGGFQVGNPTLDAEVKYELGAGFRFHQPRYDAWMSLHASWFDDYILSEAIDFQDVNGDTVPDRIRGFRNVDARFYGYEAGAVLRFGDGWKVPFAVSWTRGRNSTDDRDLAEIPALEGAAAVRYEASADRPWWLELGGRFVAAQSKVDEAFPEDPTPGYSVYHLRAGVELTSAFSLEMGIENLFDKEYNEHLTREAMLAVGDLMPGDEVPEPERSVYLTVRATF